IHLTISLQKLQQKALQQPKQKKSKSAEFLMGREQRDTLVGIENPAFDGGGGVEISLAPPAWLGREIRGDRPDSTLAAHPKKMELRAAAKERGNQRGQNDFDPSWAEQTDPRRSGTAGAGAVDELELTTLNADENRLYHGMSSLLDEEDTFINIPGTLPAFRDEEVLEVKAGDPVLEQRLLLHSGGEASGSGPSQTNTAAKTQAGVCAGLEAGRMVMDREGTAKMSPAEEVIPHYAQQPRERVRPDMITLGSLSLQQVRATKRNICPLLATEWKNRESKMQVAVNSVSSLCSCVCSSTSSENPSLRALAEGQEEATAKLGRMTELPESSSSSASRPPWPVTRSTTLQPVEVRVCCVRAARDKLPRGLYTVSVALHGRLGGPALAWCSKKEQQQRAPSAEPVAHRGRFWDTDLHFNQSLLMLLPAACELVPSMVLVFQLILLPGGSSHVGSVLAWGAFPVCGPSLGLVQGRFKTPLLRGEPSTQLDQFRKMEAIISSDLDHWLCNLYFQVKRLPSQTYGGPERRITLSIPSPYPPVTSQTEVQPALTQPQLCPREQGQANPPGCILTGGSPLHLSADSACSSSSLPGLFPALITNDIRMRFSHPPHPTSLDFCSSQKKPIKKTNSRGPSVSGGGGSAPHLQAEKQKMQPSTENLSKEEMEEFTFSLHSAPTGHGPRLSRLSERARLALSMLPSELGLPLPGQQRSRGSWRCSVRQLGLIMLLLALMWFVRLYLHYCSQWLYLQAIAVPVNKFQFHAHTVDLVYQSSLLHTREELAMVVAGPLTLNAVTFLLVLIRWGCQQMFGSLPSFTSKFIMAQGVWTVLDPLAVFAVDAVLGRLAYSPDTPVGDAAKLYWHFYRVDQSGAAGVIITLFLYTVLFLLSTTILSINILRFHNDGRMLDVFQRLTATEGKYFLPQDLELSNQELSYIVKKAEQWRGFNGERRKVAVYDYICTVEDPLAGFAAPTDLPRDGATLPEGETSTHVAVYTLYLSGLRQRYRHFLRQPDGAIVEVGFERLLTKKEGGEMSLRFRKHSLFSSLPRSPLQEGEGRNGCKE
uniref:Orofacial cleft 1 candidate gene 1 protein n=1 Tax=Gasterosteus aculeatus aculeatus TaxID=481459 RepID=A0AAQ4RE29_GASAC